MPFSNQPSLAANKVQQDLPTLQERYALRRCMAETALGKLYWAQDLKRGQNSQQQANVLVFTLLPTLAQNPVFEQVLGHILPTYQQATPGMPQISDDGKTADGTRWMVMQNIGGMLLSERFAELDDRGIPIPEALELLDHLSTTVASQRPDGVFGYLEPGAILLGEKVPCLLTAPVVAALRAAYNSNPTDRTRHTLHSGHISPEVLLGDLPTSEDDTFSIAAIAYHLLQGEAPFGKQSTLEATVRNLSPSLIRKLRPEAWLALQQGLSLKRAARQKNPGLLLRTLQRKQKPRMLLPVAALVAASAVAFSTYHLLSSFGGGDGAASNPPVASVTTTEPSQTGTALTSGVNASLTGEQGVPPALDQESVQREADKLAAETAARNEAERLAAAAKPAGSDSDFNTLLEQAANAIRTGKLTSNDPDTPAAVDYLRKAVALQPDDTKLQKLLAQMINDQHTEAETLLAANKLDEASSVLATADRLITEFTLADSLKRQVSLETEVEQAKRKAALAGETTSLPEATASTTPTPAGTTGIMTGTTAGASDSMDNFSSALERAQRAIDYGNLNSGDERSESAVSYLRPLLEKNPDHPEALKLLEKVVILQQDKATGSMRKRDTKSARTWLDDSQSLIGKYKLDDLVEEQIALEKRYRDTLAMGVFTPGSEPPSAPVADKPAAEKPAAPATTDTAVIAHPPATSPAPATNTITASPADAARESENPEAAEAAAAANALPPPVAAPTPVEVSVPADIPVQGAMETPAPANELPPVQLDAPAMAAPAVAPPSNSAIFEVPADNTANPANGNNFIPDVPDLIEVPLDVIKEGLPAGRRPQED